MEIMGLVFFELPFGMGSNRHSHELNGTGLQLALHLQWMPLMVSMFWNFNQIR